MKKRRGWYVAEFWKYASRNHKRYIRRKLRRRKLKKLKNRMIKKGETRKMAASIAKYFTLDTSLYPTTGLVFYKFDNSQADNFVNDCLIPFREAYISDEKLKSIIDEYETPREVEILERLPIKADVKSGDFGEILSFYLACAIWAPTVNVMPMKWRFKDKKDAPSHYTDIVLFKLGDPSDPTKMSANDAMITFEVKTKATKLGNQTYPTHKRKSYITYKDGRLECTILEAVFDANKDAVERAAETIPYLKTRCKDLGLKILHDQIDRFSKATSVTYKKEHNAVAIVDSAHLADQIGRVPVDLLAQHPLVKTVYCLPIENLKTIYERVFGEMPKKA